jgi:three-Cys-motif partner protein
MDLRSKINKKCKTHCSPDERKKITNNDTCKLVRSNFDDLSIRCVGDWAHDKIFRLLQYFGIFANGMKNKWNGLNYLEICSGPGRCIIRKTGEEIDGTSLSILRHPSYSFIEQAFFVDINQDTVDVLNTRITELKIKNAQAVIGDYNNSDELVALLNKFDKRNLNLVFIDPTDCSIPFQTIKVIKESLSNVDFILNFAHGTDLIRNLRKAINNTDFICRTKYSNFLGDDNYFDETDVHKLANSTLSDKKLLHHFYKYYLSKLSSIGLKYFDSKLVRNYYMLVFASSSKKGLDFWEKSQKISPNDQREFNFN